MDTVLIANRGEIACRIIRSCRQLGLATVAVYSEADAGSLHTELADQAFLVGPAAARQSYLDSDRILEVARSSGATAVHPGYGFLSENSGFARAVEAAGLHWIGPHPDSIDAMGDKERARAIAIEAGVPVLPGSPRLTADTDAAVIQQAGDAVGYPLLVKASAGGGGIGMKRVDDPSELLAVVAATQSMAGKAFADGTVFLERYVANARHVEVQVFGDGAGQAVHFHERDCSLQRRYQKIIEETRPPGISAETLDAMSAVAVRLCKHQHYRGAGTVEFVVDADSHNYYFLEMNTRIQVEHPVTEQCAGVDLVAMQIELARGRLGSLDQKDINHKGHAIECRLYAENPDKNFMPSPGPLETFILPEPSANIRVDCGFRQGDKVSFHYDPMIAKIISHGVDRPTAIAHMVDALQALSVAGLRTNRDFLIRCLQHPEFHAGRVSTGFIDRHKAMLIGS